MKDRIGEPSEGMEVRGFPGGGLPMQSVWGGVGGSHKSKSGIWNSLCKSPEARRSTGYWREHGENGGAVRGKTRAGLEDHLKDPGTSSEINTKITDPYKGHVLERGPLLLFSLSDQTVPLLSSTQDSSLPLPPPSLSYPILHFSHRSASCSGPHPGGPLCP